jgi:hypothetical protein
MKRVVSIPALLALSTIGLAAIGLTSGALAQAPEFSEVDANDDGALSILEFQAVVPSVAVTDTNGDGMVNQGEIEAALPELAFVDNGYQGGAAPVGESEYDHIIEVLEDAES